MWSTSLLVDRVRQNESERHPDSRLSACVVPRRARIRAAIVAKPVRKRRPTLGKAVASQLHQLQKIFSSFK